MKTQQIIEKLEDLIKEIKKNDSDIVFEDSNFKIDSDGWKKKGEFLENETKDIWEIRNGDYAGEQLFTWDAAMRETKKAGKTIPTNEQFEKMFTDDAPDWPLAGYRSSGSDGFYNLGSFGGYWSSSGNGAKASTLLFSSGGVNPGGSNLRALGFSVRCLKD